MVVIYDILTTTDNHFYPWLSVELVVGQLFGYVLTTMTTNFILLFF